MPLKTLPGLTAILLLLLALPAAASDYTLEIFGNANEDDTINMQDVTYTELIILEYRDETELADGKHDSKINMQDVTQIELIILGKEKEITVIDTADRVVTINKPLEEMIILNRNIVEMMRSIDVDTDKIVSVSSDVLGKEVFFPEFTDCPSVGSARSPDIETILGFEPDAVFIYATVMTEDWVQEQLEDAGITVIRLDCFVQETYIEEANKLGYIFGKQSGVDRFIEFYECCLNDVGDLVEDVSDDERPDVYIERYKPYSTTGSDTALHQLIELAGGKNIFGDRPEGYIVIDAEEVIVRNPAIIVKQSYIRGEYGYNVDDPAGLKDARDEIMGRSGLSEVTAVANGDVHLIFKEITGGKHFIAVGYFGKWFHPTIFEDLDPQAIHQEYLTDFQGLDYDLSEHGVFVYPPLES